jgi:polyisoprenoid-binding protein YceI
MLAGEFSICGITRPVSLQAEYLGHAGPGGRPPGRFRANGTLDREDWGLSWNLPLDGGGLLVSREIRIEIDLEAVPQP